MSWGSTYKSIGSRKTVEFDNSVKFYRKLHGLTLNELAAKVDVSSNTIYHIERKVLIPKLDTAVRLARCFGIPSVEELFFTPGTTPPVYLPKGMRTAQDQAQRSPDGFSE